MKRLAVPSLDTVANLAVAVACVTLSVALFPSAKRAWLERASTPYRSGERVVVPDQLRPLRTGLTLLVFVRTSCRFCAASLGFYSELAQQVDTTASARVVLLSYDEPEQLQTWLKEHGAHFDQLVHLTPGQFRVRAVPMLLLVDRNGVVVRSWIGQLNPAEQAQVRSSLLSRAS